MIFQYQRAGKVIELLNDLIKIHNDRIASYKYALNLSANFDSDLKDEFEKIVADSTDYKQQLCAQIKELGGDPLKGSTILGKIYRAWIALRVTFPGSTQKAVVSSCMYNEEIALHAYKAALSSNLFLSVELRKLIEAQQEALKTVYARIGKYRETHHAVKYQLTYFT
jgi:uncharacterized protein (TIGR02284 family)